jgi:hypothetical protein
MLEDGNPFIEKALKEGKVLYEKPTGNGSAVAGPS